MSVQVTTEDANKHAKTLQALFTALVQLDTVSAQTDAIVMISMNVPLAIHVQVTALTPLGHSSAHVEETKHMIQFLTDVSLQITA